MMNIKDDKLKRAIENMNKYADRANVENINIMEVCGTHTNSIAKYGIRSVISSKINLLSGPGCPVCVTNEDYIDAAIYLASEGVTILTFGDLIRVKGKICSLGMEKSKGRDIRVIYSISEVIHMAKALYPKNVVFLGVGFETTAPLIATLIKQTYREKITNLSFLTSIKIMPPILKKILNKNKNIHGIICPGNVAVIRGEESFKFIYEDYNIPAVICGFEAEEILSGIYSLVRAICNKEKDYGVKNLYKKCVSSKGNMKAKQIIKDVFRVDNVIWRGIGNVENSGLVINHKYISINAEKRFNLQSYFAKDNFVNKTKNGCKCSQVLLGNIYPFQCELFKKVCTPENPYGPCMVSQEGACAAYYKYNGERL